MKKNFLISILTLCLVYSCTESDNFSFPGGNDDGNTGNIPEEILLSDYRITFTAGGWEFHRFRDNLEVEIRPNNVLRDKLEYDDESKLTFITTYAPDLSLDMTRQFNYSSAGRVTSIDETGVYDVLSDTEVYNRIVNYNGNKITYEIPQPVLVGETFRIEITLNTGGLIQELRQTNSFNNTVEAIYEFSYDNSGNCTQVDITRDVAGNVSQNTYTYNYDNRRNPLHIHARTNYIPLILYYGQAMETGEDLSTLIRNFGPNNVTSSFDSTLAYTYNLDDDPIQAIVRELGTNTFTASIRFNYQE